MGIKNNLIKIKVINYHYAINEAPSTVCDISDKANLLHVSMKKIINVKDRNFISRNMVNLKERQSQERNPGTYKKIKEMGHCTREWQK